MGWGRQESCLIVGTKSVNKLGKKGDNINSSCTVVHTYNKLNLNLQQAVPKLETETKEAAHRILTVFSCCGSVNAQWIRVNRVHYWELAGNCWPHCSPLL